MKTTTRLVIIFSFLILTISNIYSVPATPNPISVTQPDGTELTIRLHGDENFNYKTTMDGFALETNSDGVYTYAQLDANNKLICTNIKANNIEKRLPAEKAFVSKLTPNLNLSKQNLIGRAMRSRSNISSSSPQKSYPLIGSPRALVILVNFSDNVFKTPSPQVAFTNLLNQDGYSANGGTGSARDYFMASTYGKFAPTFDVVGPFTLANNIAYYGANASNGDDGKAEYMIAEACAAANASVDFANYDVDNDGYVDNVFVYYAGYNEAEGASANTIWPHRFDLYSGGYPNNRIFDGKTVNNYACTSELKGASGTSMCGVGTFCHEFGHVLGLVDYYHTTESKTTLETWDIMDGGAYNNSGRTPPLYSVYDRFFLGYLTPQQYSFGASLTLNPLYQGKTQPTDTKNQAFLFSATTHNLNGANPSPKEFFMVEYRKKTGWDAYLPAEGMLIWHIDYDQAAWNNNSPNNYTGTSQSASSHMRVYLQPLTGSTLSTGTAFTSGAFTPTTWSGVDIKRPLTNIVKSTDYMTFRLMGGGDIPTINTTGSLTNFITVQGTPSNSQTIVVNGKLLSSAITLSFNNNQHYEIKRDTDPETAWAKTITLSPISSTVSNTKILIRYNPTQPSFSETHTDILLLKSTNAETIQINLSGKSTRKISVITPTAKPATNLTVGSFIANWKSVYDATGYYLTAYNTSDGSSNLTEGFDNGMKAPIDWVFNIDTITTSSVYSGAKTPALQFSNTGENVITEKYILPVIQLSFNLHSLIGNNGGFLIEAQNEQNKWTKVDSIAVTSTLKGVKNYSFDESKTYNRFRFTYKQGTGSVTFDDVIVTFNKNLEYNLKNYWVNATTDTITSDTLMSLLPSRSYYYKLKASDKCLNSDNTIKYENITDFSNLIQLVTLEDKPGNVFRVKNDDGTIYVLIPTTQMSINVYNLVGQRVRTISPTSTIVKISDLPSGQIYIIQAGEHSSKVLLPIK
jgi:M6 family metalloprotease-like protein